MYSYKEDYCYQKTNFSVFIQFFSSISTKTTVITTTTTMVATGGNGPLVPHMRPYAPRRHFEWMGDSPPSLQMYFWGGLRLCMALKVLLRSGDDASPQHWSILRTIHTLNSPQNYICLLKKVVAHPFDALMQSVRPHVVH
jgi:hypothetical protein